MSTRPKLEGHTFGRLLVLEHMGRKKRHTIYLCKCKCGTKVVVFANNLVRGLTKSCGCLNKELTIKKNTKHGQATRLVHTSEFTAWCSMKQRCLDPHTHNYQNYGGRGITICKRWLHSFTNFFTDMGLKPTPAHTLERTNNNRGYFPSNCKWATCKEQANNRRPRSR